MTNKFIITFFIIICLSITCFAADDEWNVSQSQNPDELYNEGLISDEAYELLTSESSSEYEYLIPSETSSYQLSDPLDGNSNLVSLEESRKDEALGDLSGQTPVLLASVPTSGGSYSDPILVGVDYAPDPEQGSLMEVIYNLIGKPVSAYHYRYQSANSNVQYSCDIVDYDLNWIASLALLGLVIYSVLRAGGALICKM